MKSDVPAVSAIDQAGPLLFESSPDCVKILDVDGHILAVNRNGHCALELDDSEPLEGKPWHSLWPEEFHPQIANAIQTAAAGQTGQFQGFSPTFKGTPKWWDVIVTAIRPPDGGVRHLLAVSRDVTASHNALLALHASEQRYRSLVSATSAIVWEVPASGVFESEQPSWAAFTGQTLEEYRGWGWLNAVHVDDQAESVRCWQSALQTGSLYDIEHRLRRADGQYRYMSARAVPIFNDNGLITEWIGAHVDITPRKRAEDELVRHAARQAFQLALADRLHALGDSDQITAAVAELLGEHLDVARVLYAEVDDEAGTFSIKQDWHREEVNSIAGATRSLDELGPEVVAALRSNNIVAIRDVASDAGTASQAQAFADPGIRAQVLVPLVKAGSLIAMLSLHSKVVRDWSNDELELVSDSLVRTWSSVQSHFESRRRLEAEKALRRSTEHLQFILQSAQIGAWSLNLEDGTATRSLQHDRCFGYAELVDMWTYEIFLEHVHPEDRSFVDSAFMAVQASKSDWHFECRVRWPDESIHWIATHGSLLHREATPTLMLGIVLDITERKRAEQEMRESAKRKDEFIAMLAHELRNPLAPISSAAQLLQMTATKDASVRKGSEIITRQVRHLTNLIDDLLDVSRVTQGMIELETELLDITQIVTVAVEQVMPIIRSRQHSLSVQQSPHVAVVRGDKKRLVQVIANVLTNAAKYTPEGGEIGLSTQVIETNVLIKVRDNGIGMSEELVERAFHLFQQGKRSSDRSSGGLGLGLTLVKRLVELHDGTVACSSKGTDQGTTVSISIPLVNESKSPHSDEVASVPLPAASRSLRITVVEDNVDAAAMLAMVLEASGHEVIVEHAARSALLRAQKERSDVYLLDVGLPDMDGIELMRRLRERPENSGAVFVAITGYGQPEDIRNTIAAGFDHHLVKPVRAPQLAEILAHVATI